MASYNTRTAEKSSSGRDKYSKLLSYLKKKNYEKFERFINAHVVDVNHEYGTPDNGTLLDIACRTVGNSKFVETLVSHNATINFVNIYGKAPIHNAVLNEDLETLRVLLKSSNCDPHIQDKHGNCVLHFAVVRKNLAIVELLKQHLDIDVAAWKLVDRALLDLIENHSTDKIAYTLQSLLQHNPIENLFPFLYNRQSNQFIERVQELQKHMGIEFLYDNDGFNSYMQYACKVGLAKVVLALLNMGIDPNKYWARNPMTPIMIAAFQGYHRIVNVLLDHPDISLTAIRQHNVLHCLFYGMFMSRYYTAPENDEPKDYFLCLDYLHKKAIQHNKLDVNSADEKRYTALHYAVQLNHKQAIKLLIDAGADVCQKNCNDETPLTLCNPATLEEYLDSCISFNDVHCGDQNHVVIFRYNIFTPRMRKSSGKRTYVETDVNKKSGVRDGISEIGPLMVMNDVPELRKLLKHPVILSFVTLKWHVVKKLFYCNLLFYIAFWLSVSLHVFLSYYTHKLPGDEFKNLLHDAIRSFNNSNDNINNTYRSLNESATHLHNATVYLNNSRECINEAFQLDQPPNELLGLINKTSANLTSTNVSFHNLRESLNKSINYIKNNSLGTSTRLLGELFDVLNKSICRHPWLSRLITKIENNAAFPEEKFQPFSTASSIFRYIAIVLLILLSCREFFKITTHFRHYVKCLENWLIIISVILTGVILAPLLDPEMHCSLASVTILVTWLEFVILLGRIPPLSTNQEMFKRFTYSFLKFTHWFCLIIVAYAFSLYIKYGHKNPDHYKNLFQDPIELVFKLFILPTGQFDNKVLEEQIQDVTQAFYFTLILFITVVLFNLLNGLAISDTQDVRSESELIEITSRLKFISYVETIAMNVPACYLELFYKLTCNRGRKSIANFYKGLHLFPYIFTDRTIHVSPNVGNQVLYATRDENSPNESPYMVFSEWKIDSRTVKKAMKIFEKKVQQKKSDIRDYDKTIMELAQQLGEFKTRMETLEKQNNEVLEKNSTMNDLLKEIAAVLKLK